MHEMSEEVIREFWDSHPCGESLVDGLGADHEAFFQRYDAFRYRVEAHILRRLNAINFQGKRVLEIGLGQGSDAEQIIRRGAIWSGLDLSPESISRVSTRFRLRGLPYDRLERGSALSMPFRESSFDIVFSHGVLHHIPDVIGAQKEIARVLKPGGRLIMMLYARRSLNYLLSISVVRRLGITVLYLTRARGTGIVAGHIENAKKMGLWKYLETSNFIHANTDGPSNPYSKVYNLSIVEKDFPDFELEKSYQDHMHAPPLPVSFLKPLAGVLGWHLWVHLVSRKT
jgi:ubiquinone/menaquinone biosynthesis C-methylase UbiE